MNVQSSENAARRANETVDTTTAPALLDRLTSED